MVNGEDDHALLKSEKMSKLGKSKSSSSSSSSDNTSEEDFIQFDANELRNSITGSEQIHRSNSKLPPNVGEDAQLALDEHTQHGEITGPNPFSSEFEVGHTDESSLLGVKQSPATQVMVRSDAPDPSRIPSSIFERKSPTPVEWSVASNESLFSIHGGNSSFSRDHLFLLDRSGELPNFSNSPPNAYPPISTALDPDAKILNVGNDHEHAVTAEAANAEAMKDVLRAAADGHIGKEKPPIEGTPRSASTSRHSDASTQSFAFPILTDGRSSSVKVASKQKPQAQTQQQPKAEDQKEAPEPPVQATQGNWFFCCSCSFC